MEAPQALEVFASAVRAEMQQCLEDRSLPLYDMVRYHLGWADAAGRPIEGHEGKGLRSTLCLLAAQAAGGEVRRALPAAAALEFVHNFSLVHDDIQDGSPERRHRPTVWRIWGEAQAINVGDALFALARQALLRLAERGVPAEKVLHLSSTLDEACLRLCEGQFADLDFQDRADVSVDDYTEMIGGKTAALMETSCYMGAFLGAQEQRLAQQLRQAGKHLGFAFQIRDDVLGIWGDPSITGKPVVEEIRSRKKSLPVAYAFSRAEGSLRAVLEGIYLRPRVSERAVRRVLEALEELDARGYAQRSAEQHSEAALAELRATGLSNWAMDQLEEIARFAVEREY